MSSFSSSVVALLFISAAVSPIAARDKKPDPKRSYALVFGTVYGPDDHPIHGVPIRMRRDGDKHTLDMVSDARGEFAHRFPAGKADYLVWAALKDNQAAEKTRVKVHVENDERQDITLHLQQSKR